MTTWTEERVAEFRELYAQGLSHGEIGARLGITKNASIGKAGRLGLDKRRRKAAAHPWVRLGITERAWWRRKRKIHPRPPQARPEALPPPPRDAGAPVTIVELENHHCRWPAEIPGKPMMYCGAAKCGENYSPYCLAHHAVAFVGVRRRVEPVLFIVGKRVA